MTQPLGFAIVGCGMIGRVHARAIAEVPGARLAALVSRDPKNAERLLADTGLPPCPVFPTLEAALERDDVHAVVVATPSGAHLEPATEAARAGRHVVVEKPLEISAGRCDAIIETCNSLRVKLCTIFPSRFHDANVALKKAVAAGRFGRLTLAEVACKWWRSQDYYDEGGWKGTQALDGGGALMNQGIHSVDLLLWMMGEAESVAGFTATLAHERIEVEDTAVAAIRFRSGALGVIQAATSAHPGLPKTIAIHGDRGSVVIDQEDVSRWEFRDPSPDDDAVRQRFAAKVSASGGASDPRGISIDGHVRQLADFVAAIREKREPAVDGREGRKAVRLIEAIYESGRTGRVVRLDD